ncbi:MAG TPA: discoidin domain-containing protein [Terriglobia bacterium]|nr:discoidin domain-containing protein [Terriglobia bacterium]
MRTRTWLILTAGLGCFSTVLFFLVSCGVKTQNLVVDATSSHVANTFSPVRAFGAGIDRIRSGNSEKLLSEPLLKQILSAGWQSVSYRQNTELHVEAWHWNPKGSWSDPAGQGYFTGNAAPGEMIRHSYAYPLPHRGFSRGDGNGYSRLTDGNSGTYWKSNPYLTRAFTGEEDSLHPQWIVIDMGSMKEINAIRIAWTSPYAQKYRIQFWTGKRDPLESEVNGVWQTFPQGSVADGRGGTVTMRLASWMIPVRYLRIWMTASSNTCDTHGTADARNCVGYAISELYVGTLSTDGTFTDFLQHLPNRQQSVTYCSSVDPWHSASDLDESKGDHVGLDFFYTCGVTRGLPAMLGVAMLYSTPDDAAAEIAYLEKRQYPISCVELGEEPDGQFMLPEDYGALYLQFAAAIHKVDPQLKLGGPAFEGVNEDVQAWPDAEGRVSWLGRFLDYLKDHGRLNDLAFFSFEHYPYEPCAFSWKDLYQEPQLIGHIMEVWKEDGLPPDLPKFVTEVNLSWQTSENFVDIMSGLWYADYMGAFFTAGGSGSFFFNYMPSLLRCDCNDSWGSFGLFRVDRDFEVKGHYAMYFASQLLAREWVQPVDEPHRLFRVASDVLDSSGNLLVTAYALERPDGQWSLLTVNKDHEIAHMVKIAFRDSETGKQRFFAGQVERVSFGASEYQWHANGANGYADPDGPPAKSKVDGKAKTLYRLPKASITVLRGRISDE